MKKFIKANERLNETSARQRREKVEKQKAIELAAEQDRLIKRVFVTTIFVIIGGLGVMIVIGNILFSGV